MEKMIVQFRPKQGVDLDRFWHIWSDKYAACFKGCPGLSRYIISHFQQSHGPGGREDPDQLWGMEEFWYEDQQSFEKTRKAIVNSPEKHSLLTEFRDQLAWKWAAWVEERLIVDSGYTELVKDGKSFLKIQVTFRLREGASDDDTWKLWIVGHSQDHLHCGVRKYACNRVKQVLEGDPNRTWGMPQIWYENKEASEYDHKEGIDYLRSNLVQKQIFEDFHKRTAGNWGAFMQEKIIV